MLEARDMRCVLFYMLEVAEVELCLPEVLKVLEVVRCVLFCMLNAALAGV